MKDVRVRVAQVAIQESIEPKRAPRLTGPCEMPRQLQIEAVPSFWAQGNNHFTATSSNWQVRGLLSDQWQNATQFKILEWVLVA